MRNAGEILAYTRSVLLVDWPDTGVPRALIRAGLKVFGYCPDQYSEADILTGEPDAATGEGVYAPSDGETGHLVFHGLDAPPDHVDLVCTYRPSGELPDIFHRQVLPLGAKALWSLSSEPANEARQLAQAHGVDYIESVDIATLCGTFSK